jgi:hypothetical protein
MIFTLFNKTDLVLLPGKGLMPARYPTATIKRPRAAVVLRVEQFVNLDYQQEGVEKI